MGYNLWNLVGVITSIPIYLYNKGKNIKFIKYIIEDIERNKK